MSVGKVETALWSLLSKSKQKEQLYLMDSEKGAKWTDKQTIHEAQHLPSTQYHLQQNSHWQALWYRSTLILSLHILM